MYRGNDVISVFVDDDYDDYPDCRSVESVPSFMHHAPCLSYSFPVFIMSIRIRVNLRNSSYDLTVG